MSDEPSSGLDEDELVARLTAGLGDRVPASAGVVVGVGDDCAVLESADPEVYDLLKTDAVVAGVHFSADSDAGEAVGRKALCRALSDVAAMGGVPRAAVITLALPPDFDLVTVEGWYRGLKSAAEDYAVALVGGETTSTKFGDAMLSVAIDGWVERDRCVLRSGARVGDLIAVTGQLGGSLASGRHLNFAPRLAESRWLVERQSHCPTAMMDLSDGLAKDLPRLAKASGVGYRIDVEALPRHDGVDVDRALGDGEDYELLLTFSPRRMPDPAEWKAAFPGLSLTVIGVITADVETPLDGGWDHFENDE